MTKTIGSFYEFFAGGGMARAGLGDRWKCLFANDFDHKKSKSYRNNWGDKELKPADIRTLTTDNLPNVCDLVWASFPCQDLSLAGGGAGLKGERSGTFWPFWELMVNLDKEGRTPNIIILENVCGTLTSHKGKDFSAICSTLNKSGYQFGAVVIDASLFVPQSRPRLFFIAVKDGITIPSSIVNTAPTKPWHTRALSNAFENLKTKEKNNWVWWDIPTPPKRVTNFSDLIEENPESVSWNTAEATRKILSMMSDINRDKVNQAKKSGKRVVGAIYKRTRHENGCKVQRAEVRFDNIAGCLRTPAGGSSRQIIMVVEGNKVRTRLISSRETARLMGLPETYLLPENYNEAYHLTGDGVAVPVVRHLAENIIEPILKNQNNKSRKAA